MTFRNVWVLHRIKSRNIGTYKISKNKVNVNLIFDNTVPLSAAAFSIATSKDKL